MANQDNPNASGPRPPVTEASQPEPVPQPDEPAWGMEGGQRDPPALDDDKVSQHSQQVLGDVADLGAVTSVSPATLKRAQGEGVRVTEELTTAIADGVDIMPPGVVPPGMTGAGLVRQMKDTKACARMRDLHLKAATYWNNTYLLRRGYLGTRLALGAARIQGRADEEERAGAKERAAILANVDIQRAQDKVTAKIAAGKQDRAAAFEEGQQGIDEERATVSMLMDRIAALQTEIGRLQSEAAGRPQPPPVAKPLTKGSLGQKPPSPQRPTSGTRTTPR